MSGMLFFSFTDWERRKQLKQNSQSEKILCYFSLYTIEILSKSVQISKFVRSHTRFLLKKTGEMRMVVKAQLISYFTDRFA